MAPDDRVLTSKLHEYIGQRVHLKGRADVTRHMGGFSFLILKDRSGIAQIVYDSGLEIKKYAHLEVQGTVRAEPQAPGNCELVLEDMNVLSLPTEPYPISMRENASENIEVTLKNRPISLRNPRAQNIFTLQAHIAEAYREYFRSQDFIEIFSPKIVPQGAESGATLFKLDYFGKPAFLAQSPQFYKQIMAGSGFERVFEIGHVYRAEKHNTARHLNEYVSMDAEMAYIDSMEDVMRMEEGFINALCDGLRNTYGDTIPGFEVPIPRVGKIPRVPLGDMKQEITKRFGKSFDDIDDIDPEGERLATAIAQQDFGTDAVFLTHYPAHSRPFYAMPAAEGLTESFDLIMQGSEITTGGQRIHDYQELIAAMKKNNIPLPENEGYLMAFKHGMPPHGGFGMGLERLTAQILQLPNIKEASLFPRDRKRFSP
jgi:nondiscriminating aspartyl-tRNA synthetase